MPAWGNAEFLIFRGNDIDALLGNIGGHQNIGLARKGQEIGLDGVNPGDIVTDFYFAFGQLVVANHGGRHILHYTAGIHQHVIQVIGRSGVGFHKFTI